MAVSTATRKRPEKFRAFFVFVEAIGLSLGLRRLGVARKWENGGISVRSFCFWRFTGFSGFYGRFLFRFARWRCLAETFE